MRFNFNVFFSLLYLLTFYFGFPLTCLLVFQFDVEVVPVEFLLQALLAATAFYAIYYVTYKVRLRPAQAEPRKPCAAVYHEPGGDPSDLGAAGAGGDGNRWDLLHA